MYTTIKNEEEFKNIQKWLVRTEGEISLIIRDNNETIDFSNNYNMIQLIVNIGKQISLDVKFPGNEGELHADILTKAIFSGIYKSLIGNKYGVVLKINIDNSVVNFLGEKRDTNYPYDYMISHIIKQTEADLDIITIIDVYNLNIEKYRIGKNIKVDIPKYIDSDNYIMANTSDFKELDKVEYVNTLTYEKNQINLILLNNEDNIDRVTMAATILTDISVRAKVDVMNESMLIQYINNNSEGGKIPLISVPVPFKDLRNINSILNECLIFKSKCLDYSQITYSIVFDLDADIISQDIINKFINEVREARLSKDNLILVRVFTSNPVKLYKIHELKADKIYRIDDVEKYVLLNEKNNSVETTNDINDINDKFLIPIEPGRVHVIQTNDSLDNKNIISIINDISISLIPNLIYMVDNFDITKDIKPLSMMEPNSICVIELDSLKNMILYDIKRLAIMNNITVLVFVKNDINLFGMIYSADNVIKYDGGLKEVIKSRI